MLLVPVFCFLPECLQFSLIFEGESSNTVELATADLGREVTVTDWPTGVIVLTWNGDDGKFELDEAHYGTGESADTFTVKLAYEF